MKITDKEINAIAYKIMEDKQDANIPVLNKKIQDREMQNEDVNSHVEKITGMKFVKAAPVQTLMESNGNLRSPVLGRENPVLKSLRECRLTLAKAAKSLKEKGLTEEFDKLSQVVSEISAVMDTELPKSDQAAPVEMPKKKSMSEDAKEGAKMLNDHISEGCGMMKEWKDMHEEKAEETPKMMVSEAHAKMEKASSLMTEACSYMEGKEPGAVKSLDVMAMEDVESALGRFGLAGLLEGVASLLASKAHTSEEPKEKQLYQVESKLVKEIVKTLEG